MLKKPPEELLNREPKVHEDNQTDIGEGSVLSYSPRLISELSADKEKIDWIWEGFIARGHVTLLSALWKSGKSTLISQLLKSIQEEKSLAGQETFPSKVLILSEESEFLWARRREELKLDLEAWVDCRPIKKKLNRIEWEKYLEKTSKFCEENEIGLVIIDTLAGFWGVDNENDAAKVGSALLPINNFLDKDIAVFLIHHFRKSGGSEGVAARGSGALGSFVDVLLEFSRLDRESPTNTQRVLRAYSRFEETPPEVVIEMIGGEYLTRGTRSEVSKEARLQIVVQILRNNPKGLTSTELFDTWDDEEHGSRPTTRTIRRYLDNLLYEDRVQEVGRKQVGKKSSIVYGLHGLSSRQDSEKTPVLMKEENTNNKASSLRQDTYLSIGISPSETPPIGEFRKQIKNLSLPELETQKKGLEAKLKALESLDSPGLYNKRLKQFEAVEDQIKETASKK